MDIIRDILYDYVNEDIGKVIYGEFESYYNSKSQKDKILFYFKIEAELKNKDIQEIFKDYEVNTLTRRLEISKYIENIDKEGKAFVYKITEKGINYLQRKMQNFLDNNYDYCDYMSEKRKEKVDNSDAKQIIKDIHAGLIDSNLRPNERDQLIINLKDLAECNYETTDIIYGNFKESINIIKEIYYEDIEDIKDENIIFTNPHETVFQKIHNIDRETKQFIFTKGLVTSKKESIVSKTLNHHYLCDNSNCPFSENVVKTLFTLKKCPKCKSNVSLMKEERVNQLESKITDVDSGISFPLYLQGDLASKFAYVELGDEIEVIGYLEDKVIEDKTGTKETIKVLVVNNFHSTDYIKELTKEETDTVEKILSKYEDPKEYLLKPFIEYIEQDWLKELIIIQQLTRLNHKKREVPINIAIMGEPGVGKNELIKLSEEYFPTCDAIVGADITDAGFKGTVNRDTGIKEVGLAKKCQGGTIFFNEFDKFVKSNPNGKKGASQLLNASITEQEIRLNKAGIRIRMKNLDLRHNIVFNPLEEKVAESNKLVYDLMGHILDKSLLSRMLPVYIGKDAKRSKEVFGIMLEDKDNTKLPKPDNYKLVIRYLRAKEIEFTPKAKELLKEIYDNFLKNDTNEVISVERIGQMILQLCKGVCRFHNQDKCDKKTVAHVYKLYLKCLKTVGITPDNLEQLFLDKTPGELQKIRIIKDYIILTISEPNTRITYEDVLESFKDYDETMIKDIWEELKKEGKYIELPKGVLRLSKW